MQKVNSNITRFKILADLAKIRLSSAVTLSAITGYILSSNSADKTLIILGVGILFLASGAAALNQVSERTQDRLMERTRQRPIPANKISVKEALIFSAIMLISGSILLLSCGLTPFLLGLLCVALYNILYTRLKQITAFAIIPGAIVGTIPPLIGYVAAGGQITDEKILIFAGFMFLWQLPHFWLLIIKYNEDYKRAGIKTITHFIEEKHVPLLVFSWVLLTSVYIAVYFGISDIFGKYFSKIILIANPVFIIVFFKQLFSEKKTQHLTGAFMALNSFSILLMLALIADSLIKYR